jgi:signal transduction histidine kinase
VSWRSVRVRLTVLLVAVAALGMVLAATLGVSRIEQSLVDDVLDDTAQSLLLNGASFKPEEIGGIEVFGGAFPAEVFENLFGSGFLADEFGLFAVELEDLAIELDRIGVLDGLLAQAESSRADGLPVLTSFGLVAHVGIDGGETTFPDIKAANYGRPLTSELNLQELVFAGVDLDVGSIFDGIIVDGEFDELSFDDLFEERMIEHAATVEVASMTADVDGVELIIVADIADVNRSVDKIRSVLWATIPVLLLLAGVATWILTGRALSPVRRMSGQVAVISGGTLHERVPVPTTRDEIQELGATMNGMLDRLEADDHRLRQFVSDASHELRSPVAVLRSEAEVALRSPETADVEELAEGVLGESVRLERLVADLLVLARGDEARGPVNFVAIDLDDIVLAEAARRRRVPVDTSSVSAGQVSGTEEGCTRLLVHLLDNAARHADAQVAVGLQTDAAAVTLWVDDDGPGIPLAERDTVFERFARLESARTRDTGGAGLGLAVVEATVTAMGGTVTIDDSPLGGARFVARWPREVLASGQVGTAPN